ncbi:response regulator [Algoriphagus hitonicola]|uniref:Response regulator receiver domain-containing protein n=1 Tax=Algoriphagus hitonicola TaxID=435880 RepID=A0A1I2T8I9_9BACT|nr:response regulator [Algoriphagus hitonicola]SFG61225.1 Response regulator receiver domain-containing protein [Algoriphagus hitonicola]
MQTKNKLELLLVDDDEVLLMILHRMFLKADPSLDIKRFESGDRALQYLSENPNGDNRFMLVDINLKDMTGWDFLSVIEETNDPSKIILITSSVDSTNHGLASRHPNVIHFFEKSITFSIIKEILETIEEKIEKE